MRPTSSPEGFGGGIDLAFAAVDDYEIGYPPLRMSGTAAHDFGDHASVVGGFEAADAEMAILTGFGIGVDKYCHGAGAVSALDIGNIVALDAAKWLTRA